MSADVGQSQKCGSSLQNRVVMSFHSKVMAIRLLDIRHLEIRMSLDMSRDQFYAHEFITGIFADRF